MRNQPQNSLSAKKIKVGNEDSENLLPYTKIYNHTTPHSSLISWRRSLVPSILKTGQRSRLPPGRLSAKSDKIKEYPTEILTTYSKTSNHCSVICRERGCEILSTQKEIFLAKKDEPPGKKDKSTKKKTHE